MARGTKRKVADEPAAPTDDDVHDLYDSDSEVAEDSGADKSSSGEDSSDSDGSRSDDAGEDEDDSDDDETVDVDLEFFDPAEGDFHGLKALLKTYLDGNEFNGCSELVELIIQQVCPQAAQ